MGVSIGVLGKNSVIIFEFNNFRFSVVILSTKIDKGSKYALKSYLFHLQVVHT